MLGNPNWFKRRKYTGWGLTPKSWEGWAYILVSLLIIFSALLATRVMGLNEKYQLSVTLAFLVLLALDTIDISRKIKKDERETEHEAFAERNVSWYMAFTLGVGIIYQTFVSIFQGHLAVDPFIIVAILGGAIIKGFTNWYLSDK